MRKLLLTTGAATLLLAGGIAAQAASMATEAAPVKANSQAMEAIDQDAVPPVTIRQQIQDQLGKSGYTDVTVMPSSFLVRAKNKRGDPVEMVIGPDSFTQITEVPAATAAAPGRSAPKAAAGAAVTPPKT